MGEYGRSPIERIKRSRPSASTVAVALALAALFISLGGAALAVHIKLGKNDVKAKNIKKNAVTTKKVKDNSLTGSDIDEATLSGISPTALDGITFFRSQTARLSDAPGGSIASQDLFTIGRVDLSAFCSANASGLSGGVTPTVQSNGAVLVGDLDPADQVVALQPNDPSSQVIVSRTRSIAQGLGGQEASFAILDKANTSASGVTAVSVDPATGDCVITAHAIG